MVHRAEIRCEKLQTRPTAPSAAVKLVVGHLVECQLCRHVQHTGRAWGDCNRYDYVGEDEHINWAATSKNLHAA
jgi:hypothetical protein